MRIPCLFLSMLALSVTIPLSAQQENLAPEHAARMAQSAGLAAIDGIAEVFDA